MPHGTSRGTCDGRRYAATRSLHADGRSEKVVARELGGSDYVSVNVYRLSDGRILLRPCEMSREKVVDFVTGYAADPVSSRGTPS